MASRTTCGSSQTRASWTWSRTRCEPWRAWRRAAPSPTRSRHRTRHHEARMNRDTPAIVHDADRTDAARFRALQSTERSAPWRDVLGGHDTLAQLADAIRVAQGHADAVGTAPSDYIIGPFVVSIAPTGHAAVVPMVDDVYDVTVGDR